MIIWIDGTYGVGKSTVAKELLQSLYLPNLILLDSDEYYFPGLNSGRYFGDGMFPQNNKRFLSDFRGLIETDASRSDATVIVAMSVSMDECRNQLLLPLASKFCDLIHVVLTADKNTILARIDADPGRDKYFAVQHLDRNLIYLKDNYPHAEWINTDNLTPSEIAKHIVRLIRERQ